MLLLKSCRLCYQQPLYCLNDEEEDDDDDVLVVGASKDVFSREANRSRATQDGLIALVRC